MEKKQIILPSKKFANADDQELELKLNLDNSDTLMRIGERDIILDIDEQYYKERNESINYKIYGKLKMVFRNLYSGSTDYSYLNQRLYLTGDGSNITDSTVFDGYLPYDEFAFLRKDVYREVNLPVTSNTLGTFTPNIVKSGSTAHTTVTPISAPYQNWNLYLSYVYSGDSNFKMDYTLTGGTKVSFTAKDGIPFRVTYGLIETGSTYYELTSPVEHGMNEGEHIVLSGGTLTGLTLSGRTFYINSVGNETFDSKKYVINIIKSQIKTGTTFSTIMLGKRCKDFTNIVASTSQYYVHKHKTLTDTGGYIMDSLGFESPIFEDEKKLLFENSTGINDVVVERNRMESVLYDFKEPLKLSGLTNNLGFSPTNVFVTAIFRNGNGYFNYPPKVGYKFNFHDTWIDEHFSGTTSNEIGLTSTSFTGNTNLPGYTGFTFLSGQTLPIGSILNGAFVEYNPKEMTERIVSEAFHKITNPTNIFDHNQDTNVDGFSGATSGNTTGLIYQPHYRIKLRELSPYTETANTNDIFNLPENAKYDPYDKVWRWRDIYDHGYVDSDGFGTDFPFMNGNHYVKANINFYLRNERFYKNKSNGITSFMDVNNKNSNSDC
jgi:hypothetical protein